MKNKSVECYCGNTFGSYGTAASKSYACNAACPNNTNQICGGNAANSVYLTKCPSI